jgi:hypothetical protein
MALVAEARDAIVADRFPEFKADFYRRYLGPGAVPGERGAPGRREGRLRPGDS